MKRILTTTSLLVSLLVATADAQTTVSARVGTDTAAGHFVEAIHQYPAGDWLTGAGYIDTDNPKTYREVYGGAGKVLLNTKRLNVLGIGFVNSATGSGADGVLSIVPWFLATTQFGPVTGTANYYIYKPLRTASGAEGVVTQNLEHAKAEYDFGQVLAGVGYAGTKVGDGVWQHKPFITATYQSSFKLVPGNFEVWLQRPAEGKSAFQLRYSRSF